MSFDQGEFDFNARGDEGGWRRWREELEEKQRAFEARWGVALGKPVVVQLRDHAKPLTGMLEWISEGGRADDSRPPRFRLRGLEFGHEEIASLSRAEPED